ncbi:glycosyltransferase [Crocinitomix catalasitica]|nr:glycosyltransferase [Crocinitomix catalasitica]
MIAVPDFDYSDDKSAVLSYLISIKKAFEQNGDNTEFALNQKGDQSQYSDRGTDKKKYGFKELIKYIVRQWPWLHQSLVLRRYLKDQELLFRGIVGGKKYDLIIEYHILGSTIGLRLAKKWGAQFSVIFDSPSPEQFKNIHNTKSAYWSTITNSEKQTMEAADLIMCYSPACQKYLELKYSIRANINILPCQLHKEAYVERLRTKTFNIGFIGSFLEWHKLDLMVKVFAMFHKKYENSRLMLIGFGRDWHRINELVKNLGLVDFVDMPGFVSEEELEEYKRKFTIATMPGSNWYGSPLKLFEYAQMGIPFIAPVSETVDSIFKDGEHCLFVKSEDEEGTLMQALELYYNDSEGRDKMGENARRYVENKFNKDDYRRRLLAYLG